MRKALGSIFARPSRHNNDGGGEESGSLLPTEAIRNSSSSTAAASSAGSGPGSSRRISEYESIGLTVVLDAPDDDDADGSALSSPVPVLMHDFTGPILAAKPPQSLNGDGGASSSDDLDTASLILERLSSAGGGGGGLLDDAQQAATTTLEDSLLVMDELPPSDVGGTATLASEVAGMAKNLIGCGCLSLPNGIARCANRPSALWDANLWIVLLAVIFGYFCYLIAKVCHLTGRTTYRGIWEGTVGHRGSLAVSVANALKAAMADLAYATILSDTLRSLLLGILGWQVPRVVCLFLVTIGAILPLCLLPNLHVLAPFSVLGTAGVAFTAGSMVLRYLDGSYQEGGKFYDDLPLENQPYFGSVDNSWSFAILPFVCMVYEAYVMHYNSARFYTELKDRTLPRFGVAVFSSFGIAAVAYMVIASFGFLTFGGNSAGFILNNYSPYDPLANISRVAIGISVLTAYPIVFFGVRDGCLDTFEVPAAAQTPATIRSLTFVLLSLLTLTAVFVTDLGLINAVGGGLVATAIVFVFPTLMFHRAILQKASAAAATGLGGESRHSAESREVGLAGAMTAVGVVIGVIGAYTAVADTSSGGSGSGSSSSG